MSQQFNWRFYLEYNSDLTQKGLATQKQAQWHYARYGRREGRICNINEVDWKYYLNRYPDIPKAGLNTMPKAKMHYAKWGKNEGRIPNRLYEQYNRPQQQQQQQLPMKWAVSKQSSTQNVVIHKNTTKKPNIKFNILIRCTYRPTYFKKCIESVLFQTHQQFNVIMCYDDERCMEYLQKYKNHSKIHIFKAPEVNKDQPYFYNLYCNFLLEKVKDGWILFLDDDDMFAHKNSLHVIANNIETNDDCVFWQVKLGKIIVFPPNIHDIRFRQISCIGFCFHSLYKNKGEWAAQGGSDYKYISEVLKAHTRFKRKQIHSVLTGTQHSMNGQFGLYDKIKLEAVLKKFDIKQGHVSESLIHLKHRFLNKYSLTSINKNNAPALFFGVYNKYDIETILNHGGDTLVIFGGSEVSNIQAIKAKNNIRILSISRDMQTRLSKYNICSCYVLLNMVDSFIFKPVPTEELGKKIFIYNGYTKKKDNASIYNEPLINEVVKRCPDKEFIFSNDLGVPYEKMPEIYKQCYIGLRLTGHDGNANMVQEMEAMKIPVVHNHSEYGLKWKNVEDIVNYVGNNIPTNSVLTIDEFDCINVENPHSYQELSKITRGDIINEYNFLRNIQKKATLYVNNEFISGNRVLKPKVTISRNKTYDQLINKNNTFASSIPYRKEFDGLYCITKSMVEAIQDKNSLLYPHVYSKKLFYELNSKKIFLQEQKIDKNWYNWATDDEIKQLKLKYFPEDAFVICICGRIAINSYPKSLLEAIKILRNQGHNIHLLALTKFEVNPHRLTPELYDEITSYDWVKSFTVDKKDVLNYFRMCDILASTYRDYCNHVGGSNKIKEYLLCNKPILCSRGKERENELGKDYPGFYDCETCNSVPPLCWTQEFIRNPNCYKQQYETYFNAIDKLDLSCSLYIYMKLEIKQICDIFSRYLHVHTFLN